MLDDVEALEAACNTSSDETVSNFDYRPVREVNRMQHACEQWPLLLAACRALEAVAASEKFRECAIPVEAAELWQE